MKFDIKNISLGLICGFMIGTLTISSFTASNPITAYEDNRFGFQFNGGPRITSDSGINTIVYNNRSYVPVRFITENLGATVNWDDNSRTISIDLPEKIVEVEKIVEKCPDEQVSSISYKGLPQSFINKDLRVDITYFDRNKDEINSNFYLSVENKGQDPWQIELFETKFIGSDGVTYSTKGVPVVKLDSRLYNDIRQDEDINGYVSVSSIPESLKGGVLQITIRKNTIENDIILMEFPIKINQ